MRPRVDGDGASGKACDRSKSLRLRPELRSSELLDDLRSFISLAMKS